MVAHSISWQSPTELPEPLPNHAPAGGLTIEGGDRLGQAGVRLRLFLLGARADAPEIRPREFGVGPVHLIAKGRRRVYVLVLSHSVASLVKGTTERYSGTSRRSS